MPLFYSSGNRDNWPRTTEFLKELSHQLRQVSGEANSFADLAQRLSVAVQQGNAASILGTMKVDSEDEEFIVQVLLYCCIVMFYCNNNNNNNNNNNII